MAVFDLGWLLEGVSTVWSGYLRDWGRNLRSVNHPETTRYNYLLPAAQLARYLGEDSPDPEQTTLPRTRPRSLAIRSRRSRPG